MRNLVSRLAMLECERNFVYMNKRWSKEYDDYYLRETYYIYAYLFSSCSSSLPWHMVNTRSLQFCQCDRIEMM